MPEDDGLAPVIPLFGRDDGGPGPMHPARRARADRSAGEGRARAGEAPAEREARDDRTPPPGRRDTVERGGRDPGPAIDPPVADAGRDPGAADGSEAGQRVPAAENWHTTWRDLGPGAGPVGPVPRMRLTSRGGVRFVELDESGDEPSAPATGRSRTDDADGLPDAARAEENLVKALRSRSLSETEARSRLRRDGVPADAAEEIIDRLLRIGALDDAALAEQLVHIGADRKGQGRRAIAQTLSARGIARELVDAVLEEMPNDDDVRALAFARSRVASLARFDEETAMRRLLGQLGRRGFAGSLAASAARRALKEARGAGEGGVRFR